jgi:pimeloyl-ACP methyl ester carboxylesterase
VLALHGWDGRGGQFFGMAPELVARGFQLVVFDAPGHGEARGQRSSLLHFADAFDDVAEEVRPTFGPLHGVVAHSMGGAAVTYALSRFTRRASPSIERPIRDVGLPARRFVFLAPPIDVGDFVRTFITRTGLHGETEIELRRSIEERFGVRMQDLHAPTLATELRAPLLVIHDESDREVPLAAGRALADAWPGAQLSVTRALGHMRILRDPAVVERTASFLEGG